MNTFLPVKDKINIFPLSKVSVDNRTGMERYPDNFLKHTI